MNTGSSSAKVGQSVGTGNCSAQLKSLTDQLNRLTRLLANTEKAIANSRTVTLNKAGVTTPSSNRAIATTKATETTTVTTTTKSTVPKTTQVATQTTAARTIACTNSRILYGSLCYEIVRGTYAFSAANQYCTSRGGKPTDITSKAQYDFLMAEIRKAIPAGYSEFWIGLRFNPPTATLTLSTGQPAPYVTWWRGKPYSRGATYTNVYFWLAKNAALASGMAEWDPVQKQIGVICQYSP